MAGLRRKLTTILSADVAGYSRLMSHDEEGTHARLVAISRDLVEPAIEMHGGAIIKKTGDGCLAEFASVVEAVRCAIGIQDGVCARNEGCPPDQDIAFRIGINIGDVIVESDDIYGNGVNVAARLESLAPAGGIVVSRAVFDHVQDKLDLSFEDLGEQKLKNIARSVHAFRISRGTDSGAERTKLAQFRANAIVRLGSLGLAAVAIAAVWWLNSHGISPPLTTALSKTSSEPPSASRLSIAVLPFANLGGDAQQDYFVDGITESLTTDLSRALPGSFVVARGTAFTYKGVPVDFGRLRRDLSVRYLLEGSVIPEPDRVRVNARLIDTDTGTDVWAERFDNERRNVLEIQDQIVGRLSRSVGLKLIDIEARRSERERHANPSAVDLVMRGQAIANRPTSRESMIAARALFQQALEHDRDNVDALAGVAGTYVFEVLNSYYDSGREKRLEEARALIRRALELDPRHIVALKIRAALFRADGKFEEAIAASRAVIAQNPGEPWAYKEVGLSKLYLGRFQEALDWFEKADQIGPRDPSRWIWFGAMGRVQFFLGHNDEAIRLFRLSVEANPKDVRAYALLSAIYAFSGRAEETAWALSNSLRLQPGMTIKRLFEDWSVPLETTSASYRHQHERFREGLRLAGMREE